VRRKAAYLEFEANGDAEFKFFLAEKLGRTVVELGEMPHDEYMRWGVYFGRKAQRQDLETKKAKGRR
jgi:hypothetical protein